MHSSVPCFFFPLAQIWPPWSECDGYWKKVEQLAASEIRVHCMALGEVSSTSPPLLLLYQVILHILPLRKEAESLCFMWWQLTPHDVGYKGEGTGKLGWQGRRIFSLTPLGKGRVSRKRLTVLPHAGDELVGALNTRGEQDKRLAEPDGVAQA